MKVWELTEPELAEIVASVNAQYNNNIRVENVRTEGKRVRTTCFTLRTYDSRGLGSRRGPSRRTTSACWHVHRDVLRGVFALHPDARVVTMLADYRGSDDFERTYVGTAEVGCWQGGMERDRREECDCTPNGRSLQPVRRYALPRQPFALDGISHDAHRVAALADHEIAEWNRFLASIGKPDQGCRSINGR